MTHELKKWEIAESKILDETPAEFSKCGMKFQSLSWNFKEWFINATIGRFISKILVNEHIYVRVKEIVQYILYDPIHQNLVHFSFKSEFEPIASPPPPPFTNCDIGVLLNNYTNNCLMFHLGIIYCNLKWSCCWYFSDE